MTVKGVKSVKGSVKKNVIQRILCAVLSLAVFIVSIWSFSIIMRKDIEAVEGTTLFAEQAGDAEVAHLNWLSDLELAVYTGENTDIHNDYKTCEVGKWLYSTEISVTDEELLSVFEDIKKTHQSVHENAITVLKMSNSDMAAKKEYFNTVVLKDDATLRELLDKIRVQANELNDSNIAGLHSHLNLMRWVSAICGVITCIALFTLVKYIIINVLQPVLAITKESKKLEKGELSFEYEYRNQNEIKDLTDTFTNSIKAINSYVADIDKMMGAFAEGDFTQKPTMEYVGDFKSIQEALSNFKDSMREMLYEIESIAEQVFSSSNEVSMGTQALAQGATEQAGSVETLSETLNAISKTSVENAKTAQQSMQQLNKANDEVSLCNEKMQEVVKAMNLIDESSQEISKILKTIEDIAFQTNILALNAAVEAARAGNSGKGFAVVADEVRNLASKSDTAAKATKELIDKSLEAVTAGNIVVSEVSEALQKTSELSSEAVSGMSAIADAVDRESKAIEEVDNGIEQISLVVQNNTATSEEQAAASQELSSQAQLLKLRLEKFKL